MQDTQLTHVSLVVLTLRCVVSLELVRSLFPRLRRIEPETETGNIIVK